MLVNFFFFSSVAILNGETPLIFFYVKLLEGLSETKISISSSSYFLSLHFLFLYYKLYSLFLSLHPKNESPSPSIQEIFVILLIDKRLRAIFGT